MKKKKLRIESLENRYFFHAAPVDLHGQAAQPHADGLPHSADSKNIVVKSWSQFEKADFASKTYGEVVIDNKSGWFDGKNANFLGFDKLEVQGDLKDTTVSVLGMDTKLKNDIQVDGNMSGSSVRSPGAGIDGLLVKGNVEMGSGSVLLANSLGNVEVDGSLTMKNAVLETTSGGIGEIKVGKNLSLKDSILASTSGIGKVEVGGKLTEGSGSEIFGWSSIGELMGKDVRLDGMVTAYKGVTIDGTDGVEIGKEALLQSKANAVSIRSDGEILNEGTVEGAGVAMHSKGTNPYALAIDNEGMVRASSSESGAGRITLKADQNAVQDTGRLIAKNGTKGGEVEIDAPWAVIWGKGSIDASGTDGGGKVLLSGTSAVVGQADKIDVSAGVKGNGGEIRILADNTTVVGNLYANGGKNAGNGGEVRIAGLSKLDFGGVIQAAAGAKGDGGQILFSSAGPETINGSLLAFGGKNSGNGGGIAINAGSELYSGGLWNVSAPQKGNGGSVSLVSSGENDLAATVLAQGGKGSGNGGVFYEQSGSIGTDLNGIVDLNARGSGNGGTSLITSGGETAITGILSADGGHKAGNAGNIIVRSDKTLYQVGTLDLSSSSGTRKDPVLEAPKISHDLFSKGPANSPIQHLFVIIGENHSFDNYLGSYLPRQGQTVQDLLSQGIVNPDGTPGPNFSKASQATALNTTSYQLSPTITGNYATLPQPNTTYALGQIPNVPDPRFPSNLPNGSYPINKYVGYSSYVGDPVHRYFQMYQQTDLGKHDLYTWVAQTVGTGGANSSPAPTPKNTYQGSVQMGYYNTLGSGGSFMDYLSASGTISDNFHQAIMGGTGANHYGLVSGGLAAVFNVNGKPSPAFPNQIENPTPQHGTNNFYTNDGYRGGSYVSFGPSGTPGTKQILQMLDSLPYKAFMRGDYKPGEYYLVNNYNPGYYADGSTRPIGPKDFNVPPQSAPNILTDLSSHDVSWKWYSQGWNNGHPTAIFDDLGDPGLFFTNVMKTPIKDNLQGMQQFWADMNAGNVPAVSFIKPNDLSDGHPASSNPALFQNLVQNIVQNIQANKKLWYSSAVMITMDESGGYYDNGYIQPLTVFGDGPRIPMITVSPYAEGGFVDHTYTDHVSIDKYIERNWKLPPIAADTIDNLPNPVMNPSDPYVPENRPAIGDLETSFHYSTLVPGPLDSGMGTGGNGSPPILPGSDRGALVPNSDAVRVPVGERRGAGEPSSPLVLAGSVNGGARLLSGRDLDALSVVGV